MKWINRIATRYGLLRAEVTIMLGAVIFLSIGLVMQLLEGMELKERFIKELEADLFYYDADDPINDSLWLEYHGIYPTLVDSLPADTSTSLTTHYSDGTAYTVKKNKLNFNTATEQDLLQTLPYITPELANRLIRFREANGGRLHSLDQLLMVKGIGEKTLARYRDVLTLE